MMMKKRVLSVLLALMMVLVLLPVTAQADDVPRIAYIDSYEKLKAFADL